MQRPHLLRTLSSLSLALSLALVILFSAATTRAAEYKPEYRLSTVLGEAFPWGWSGNRWAELVTEKTQGRIHIKMYPGVSLVSGDQTKEFTALRQGAIDLAIGSTINWSSQLKELNVFALPFLMPDYRAIDALTQGDVGKALFALIAGKDVVPLAWGENGFRQLSNSKHPIRRPADLKGLKIRVVGSPLFNETFAALGATPIQMSWADAQPAMATGAVDGQENPLTVFNTAKLYMVGQKHLTLWDYVADPLIFAVNKTVWDSWTPEDQQAVREAALQAAREEVAMARQGITAHDNALLKQIESNGVAVVNLTSAEKQAFRDATRAVYNRWRKHIGPPLVKQAEAAVAKR